MVRKYDILQRELSEVILILFGRTGRSVKIVNSRQGALVMLWFVPERWAQPYLRVVVRVSQQAISWGLVERVGSAVSSSWRWSEWV